MILQPESKPTDEQLSAYLDGELDDVTSDRIERLAAGDPETRARLEALSTVDARIVDALLVDLEDPALARLAARVIPNMGNSVVSLDARRRRATSLSTARPFVPAAIAASLALLLGFGGGLLVSGRDDAASSLVAIGPVPSATELAELLERRPTGKSVAVGSSARPASLVVATTFKDKRGRPCREFEASRSHGDTETITSVGVACRNDGAWTVEGIIAVGDAGVTASGNGIIPSSDETKDTLDALLTALGATRALSPAEENESLARGWR